MIPLARAVVRSLRVPQHLQDDATQAALLGWTEALKRHDKAKGPLTTYAWHRMRGAVLDLLRAESRQWELRQRPQRQKPAHIHWHPDMPARLEALLRARAAGYTHQETAELLGVNRVDVTRALPWALTAAHRYLEVSA